MTKRERYLYNAWLSHYTNVDDFILGERIQRRTATKVIQNGRTLGLTLTIEEESISKT